MSATADLATIDALRDLAARLGSAGHGQRSIYIEEFAGLYGWSRNKVYAQLKKIGWSSGRKTRSDLGTTKQDIDSVVALGAALEAGIRKNGKATLHTPTARSILAANNQTFKVSNARINQLLRRERLSLSQQAAPKPATRLRSAHPNHVHQVDPSLCLLYYAPGGKQLQISDAEAYKNKPETIAKIGARKCWRYVLTDHYSSSVIVRYYESAGETQGNLYDFLLYAWGRLDGRPFHGVPQVLLWDKGSANTSGAIKNALDALDVNHITHQAGNPRAKGQVENGNNLVETLFESRLKFEPVGNVGELNAAAEAWCNAYNLNAIPHYDSRLKRKGMIEPVARFGLWQTIRPEQLRLLPDEALCRYLLSAKPQERKVRPDMTVQFRHPNTKRSETYCVRHVTQAYIGCTVMVSAMVYGQAQVVVTVDDHLGQSHRYLCDPAPWTTDGFTDDMPMIGVDYKTAPDTDIERAGKAADRVAYPDMDQEQIAKAKAGNAAPFGGLDAHSHLKHLHVPATIDRPGTELTVPDAVTLDVKPMTHIQAMKRLTQALGRALTPDENRRLRGDHPDGLTEDQLDQYLEQLRNPPPDEQTRLEPGLRIVG